MALQIYQWFQAHLNYWTITLLMTIESSFIPFPSEIVVPPAAYFAMQEGSNLNIFLVVLFATLGAFLGATLNYYLALWVGRPIIYRFANSRIGHMCLINQEKVEKAEQYFDKHGAVSTFIGRLIPGIRQLISIPAGLARMKFSTFTLFTTLGAGIWNIILALLGYMLSLSVPQEELLEQIEYYNSYLSMAGYVLLAFVIIFIAYQGLKKKSVKK
ncbi:MAG: DedA family protein [Muribaculaceae bacterium]|nr:DedA family protein [Muribaculaceae bacterium]